MKVTLIRFSAVIDRGDWWRSGGPGPSVEPSRRHRWLYRLAALPEETAKSTSGGIEVDLVVSFDVGTGLARPAGANYMP
jgi:hypothetical protein